MEEKSVITFEAIYEILRKEKYKPELQKLEPTFFQDVVNYIKEKTAILEAQQQKQSIFSQGELEKTRKHLETIKKTLRELYEKRESKIANLALVNSRISNKETINSLLPEEKEVYLDLLETFDNARENILNNILTLKMPEIEKPKELKNEIKLDIDTKLVRFVATVPKFVGTDLNIYGPFKEEDVASLPSEIAELLIKNSKAEGME